MKYRIWDIRNKEYNEDLMLDQDNDIYLCVGVPMNSHLSSGLVSTKYNSTNYIIEHSIGLKDKNGKEVYQNDRVKLLAYDDEKEYETIIEVDEWGTHCKIKTSGFVQQVDYLGKWIDCDNNRIEVIGNIHEEVNNETKR